MSDQDIGEVIPASEIAAISVFPNSADTFAFVVLDTFGDVRGYVLSRNKLAQMNLVITSALAG